MDTRRSALRVLFGRIIVLATMLTVLGTNSAFAVDTTKTYNSGILVVVFLGVCALIIIAQMVPALIMLLGTVKGFSELIRRSSREESQAVEVSQKQ